MQYLQFLVYFVLLFVIQISLESLATFIHLILGHNLTIIEGQLFENAHGIMIISFLLSFYLYSKIFFKKFSYRYFNSPLPNICFFLIFFQILSYCLYLKPALAKQYMGLYQLKNYFLIPIANILLVFIPGKIFSQFTNKKYIALLFIPVLLIYKLIFTQATGINYYGISFHLILLNIVLKELEWNMKFELLYYIILVGLPCLFFGPDIFYGKNLVLFKTQNIDHMGIFYFFMLVVSYFYYRNKYLFDILNTKLEGL